MPSCEAALLGRIQIAIGPTRRSRFHWIRANHSRFDVVTFHTLESSDIISGRARHDEGKHHAVLTSGTTGPLDRNKGGFRPHVRLGHAIHPLIRRERNTLSHRWLPMGAVIGTIVARNGSGSLLNIAHMPKVDLMRPSDSPEAGAVSLGLGGAGDLWCRNRCK